MHHFLLFRRVLWVLDAHFQLDLRHAQKSESKDVNTMRDSQRSQAPRDVAMAIAHAGVEHAHQHRNLELKTSAGRASSDTDSSSWKQVAGSPPVPTLAAPPSLFPSCPLLLLRDVSRACPPPPFDADVRGVAAR